MVLVDTWLPGSDRAGHAAHHNALADAVNAVFNVKAYGATGNGTTNDTVAIQTAIAAAGASGGTVFFPPAAAFYRTVATLTLNVNNVCLSGAGKASYIKQDANSNVDILSVTGNDTLVERIRFDGQQAGLASTVGASGIRIAANRVQIQNCWIDNAKEYGIVAQNSTEVDISHNRISGTATHGITIGNPPNVGGGTGVQDFLVQSNRIYSCGIASDSATGKGISVLSGSSSQPLAKGNVIGNVIRACTSIGIELFANLGPGGSVNHVAVNGNVIERLSPAGPASQMGISLGFCNHCSCTGNVIDGCTNGIENAGGTANTVTGNSMHNVTSGGISVSGGTTNSTHSANVITGTFAYGIQDNSSPTSNTGNVYTNNRITGAGGSVVARQLGIFINNGVASQTFTITGNQVTACSGAGIYIFTSDTGIVAHNICRGNVTNAANAGSDADIYFNLNGGQLDKIVCGPNIYGSFSPNQTATDAQASQTMVVGGLKKIASQTIGTVQGAVAHGLPYTPNKVIIKMTSSGTVWESQAADGTNVYLTASAASRTCDVYVA